jgi:hypothetical protein
MLKRESDARVFLTSTVAAHETKRRREKAIKIVSILFGVKEEAIIWLRAINRD